MSGALQSARWTGRAIEGAMPAPARSASWSPRPCASSACQRLTFAVLCDLHRPTELTPTRGDAAQPGREATTERIFP